LKGSGKGNYLDFSWPLFVEFEANTLRSIFLSALLAHSLYFHPLFI